MKLTRGGTNTLSKCDALVDELEAEVFRDINTEDRAHFHRMLQISLDAISERA